MMALVCPLPPVAIAQINMSARVYTRVCYLIIPYCEQFMFSHNKFFMENKLR